MHAPRPHDDFSPAWLAVLLTAFGVAVATGMTIAVLRSL